LLYIDLQYVSGSVHTIKKNRTLVVASKQTGLEGNAYKTKYIAMSRDQNAGRIHNIKPDSSFFESVEEFKYLGTTLTNQNSIQEEIKNRLNSGTTCCNSAQSFVLVCYPKI
jgi:hypothetical protein